MFLTSMRGIYIFVAIVVIIFSVKAFALGEAREPSSVRVLDDYDIDCLLEINSQIMILSYYANLMPSNSRDREKLVSSKFKLIDHCMEKL